MKAKEFKEIQARWGLTNEAMAERCCCSLNLVEKMRSGTRHVSPRTVKIIEREGGKNENN